MNTTFIWLKLTQLSPLKIDRSRLGLGGVNKETIQMGFGNWE
ncbi:hypothetical protein [Chamaesiphon sp. VAR_48_metabat_135_sub]|nr:hypothetical protein [Chamaesiphon sp. VAR_48_metabat_135_sub]